MRASLVLVDAGDRDLLRQLLLFLAEARLDVLEARDGGDKDEDHEAEDIERSDEGVRLRLSSCVGLVRELMLSGSLLFFLELILGINRLPSLAVDGLRSLGDGLWLERRQHVRLLMLSWHAGLWW